MRSGATLIDAPAPPLRSLLSRPERKVHAMLSCAVTPAADQRPSYQRLSVSRACRERVVLAPRQPMRSHRVVLSETRRAWQTFVCENGHEGGAHKRSPERADRPDRSARQPSRPLWRSAVAPPSAMSAAISTCSSSVSARSTQRRRGPRSGALCLHPAYPAYSCGVLARWRAR